MQIIKSVTQMQQSAQAIKRRGQSIGFVPTMGALHEGHLSLIRRSRRENAKTILSIFVNPKQFGPQEDFDRYPRNFKKDERLVKAEEVDIIFYPPVNQIYPSGYLTYVQVEQLSQLLCGNFRPGHFKGVVTIVLKLLNIVAPDRLYLGQKDAQQAVIIKSLVRDLNVPVHVTVCPIIREKDGLALSSRNQYLSPSQRQETLVLYQSLKLARSRIKKGERRARRVIEMIKRHIRRSQGAFIEYVECVDADTLEALSILKGRVLIAVAVKFGSIRLIDNMTAHAL